jgi:Holliday junction resolvase-like predicted endonuclease
VARNVRSGRGEVDLLVIVDGQLVAVEVKTRADHDPVVQLTPSKRRRMVAAARMLDPRPSRIDVVTVLMGADGATIRWLKGFA